MKIALAGSLSAQVYNALAGVLVMPVYLRLMGDEAFGLIGVYFVLQALLQLLDFGITPTLARDVSLVSAGQRSPLQMWLHLRSIEFLFAFIAILLLVCAYFYRDWLAASWLNAEQLPVDLVGKCLFWMAAASLLRWVSGIYRGSLCGLEMHGYVNVLTILFTSLRFLLVIPFLYYVDSGPLAFFVYQCAVSVGELLVFRIVGYRHLPRRTEIRRVRLQDLWEPLQLAKQIGILSAIWILLTQLDKFILSRTMSLEEFGGFSLATMAAGVFFLGLPTLNQVVQPRMTILVAQGQRGELVRLYRLTGQILAALLSTVGGALALNAEPVLALWTQDPWLAGEISDILVWYTCANVLAVMILPSFLLQFAHGDVGLHIKGNLLAVALQLPIIALAAIYSGPVAVAQSVVIVRLLMLLLLVPKVHHRFLPECTYRWLVSDVLKVSAVVFAVLFLLEPVVRSSGGPLIQVAISVLVACCALLVGLLAGSDTRGVLAMAVGR